VGKAGLARDGNSPGWSKVEGGREGGREGGNNGRLPDEWQEVATDEEEEGKDGEGGGEGKAGGEGRREARCFKEVVGRRAGRREGSGPTPSSLPPSLLPSSPMNLQDSF
jgi:hypothetical protein